MVEVRNQVGAFFIELIPAQSEIVRIDLRRWSITGIGTKGGKLYVDGWNDAAVSNRIALPERRVVLGQTRIDDIVTSIAISSR